MNISRAFDYVSSSENEKIKLFCFHYAGGSAFNYISLRNFLPDSIGIYPFQMPCRGQRSGESYPDSAETVAKEAAEAIRSVCNSPFVLLGHSMGGMIASITAQILQEEYRMIPLGLFATASVPDFGKTSRENMLIMSKLDDDEFCDKLIEFNAIDSRILKIRRFREDILPITRADFYMAENYHANSSVKLKCRINVYGGIDDKIVKPDQLSYWNDFTLYEINTKMFKGDHFFIKEHMPEICEDIICSVSEIIMSDSEYNNRQQK